MNQETAIQLFHVISKCKEDSECVNLHTKLRKRITAEKREIHGMPDVTRNGLYTFSIPSLLADYHYIQIYVSDREVVLFQKFGNNCYTLETYMKEEWMEDFRLFYPFTAERTIRDVLKLIHTEIRWYHIDNPNCFQRQCDTNNWNDQEKEWIEQGIRLVQDYTERFLMEQADRPISELKQIDDVIKYLLIKLWEGQDGVEELLAIDSDEMNEHIEEFMDTLENIERTEQLWYKIQDELLTSARDYSLLNCAYSFLSSKQSEEVRYLYFVLEDIPLHHGLWVLRKKSKKSKRKKSKSKKRSPRRK